MKREKFYFREYFICTYFICRSTNGGEGYRMGLSELSKKES